MRNFIQAALILLAAPALAQEVVTQTFDGSFEDATFAVESAITNQGLVIDHVSHVGEMLARTGADLGAETQLFEAADVFLFCSASVSRQVMEADPNNIAYCPYSVFVSAREGKVEIGYRSYPGDTMDEVEELLNSIVAEATGF